MVGPIAVDENILKQLGLTVKSFDIQTIDLEALSLITDGDRIYVFADNSYLLEHHTKLMAEMQRVTSVIPTFEDSTVGKRLMRKYYYAPTYNPRRNMRILKDGKVINEIDTLKQIVN